MLRRKEKRKTQDESFLPLMGSKPVQTRSFIGGQEAKRRRGNLDVDDDYEDEEGERRLEAMVFGDERVVVDRLLVNTTTGDNSEEEVRCQQKY